MNQLCLFVGILSLFLASQHAYAQCKIPDFKAAAVGDKQSCNPIDFQYELSDYLDNPSDTRYTIDFGDNTQEGYDQSELDSSGVHIITHTYEKVSCELSGAFKVTITADRTSCTLSDPAIQTISPVIIGRKPIAGFSPELDTVCVNKELRFINETLNGYGLDCSTDALYTWDFGDGSDPFVTNVRNSPSHTYTSPGEYDVVLTIEHSCGTGVAKRKVVINDFPQPIFEITETLTDGTKNTSTIDTCAAPATVFNLMGSKCAPIVLDLKNLSDINNGLTYTWSVEPEGNGASFSNNNPTSANADEIISFTGSGNFLIALKAENACGFKTACVRVNIIDVPGPENVTIFGLDTLCGPANFDLFVDQPGGTAFAWTYKGLNGTADPVIPAKSNTDDPDPLVNLPIGKYEVSVTVTNACGTGTATEVFEVVKTPIIGIAEPFLILCEGEKGLLTATGDTDIAYQWFKNRVPITGATKNTLEVTDSAMYSVMALKTKCNILSEEIPVSIHPLPEVEITDQITCVFDDSLLLTANPLATGIGVWSAPSLPDSALTPEGIFYPQIAGISTTGFEIFYTFTETGNTKNCEQVFTKKVIVYPGPEPDFAVDSFICINKEISFPNATLEIPGQDMFWEWRFGDGATSSEKEPMHIFTDTVSNLPITLIARTEAGCIDSVTKFVNVIYEPIPSFDYSFTPLDSCGPLIVDFTSESIGRNMSYSWDFGNGITSSEENPQDVLFGPGIYNDTTYYVTLSVTNACTTVDYLDSVRVKASAQSNFVFEFDTVCADYDMKIFNYSIGEPKSYTWDFGDGSPEFFTLDTGFVHHKFAYEGKTDTTYFISLVTEGDCGFDTLVRPLVVVPKTVTAFFNVNTNKGCAPVTVDFTSNQTGRTTLIWNWGDGKPDSVEVGGLAHTRTYTQPGDYAASLIVISGCNIDTFTQVIKVSGSPIGDFTVDQQVCIGEEVTFDNLTLKPIPTTWDFGDGTTHTGFNPPPKAYTAPGTYTIAMEMKDPLNDCPGIVQKTVLVTPFPKAKFEIPNDNVCQSEAFVLPNNSTDAQSFYWTFEDKHPPSTDENPTITLEGNGVIRATLFAFSGPNQTGCSDSLTQSITVLKKPVPDFAISSEMECGIMTVTFDNLTSYPSDEFEGSLIWNFGNGNTYEGFDNIPPQLYENFSEDGMVTYDITLEATTNGGCTETFSYQLDFGGCCIPRVELPEDGKSFAFTPYNGGDNEEFRLKHEYLESFNMEIYNKWGEMVFQTYDPDEGWDGYYKNGKCEAGVYQVKVIIGGCSKGKETKEKPIMLQLYLLD